MTKYQLKSNVKARISQKLFKLDSSEYDANSMFGALQDLDTIYSLNLTGALVVQEIRQPATLEQIVQKMCSMFDAAPEDVSNDVSTIIKTFMERGWIDCNE